MNLTVFQGELMKEGRLQTLLPSNNGFCNNCSDNTPIPPVVSFMRSSVSVISFWQCRWHEMIPSRSPCHSFLTWRWTGRAEKAINRAHLFVCHICSSHGLWHVYFMKCQPLLFQNRTLPFKKSNNPLVPLNSLRKSVFDRLQAVIASEARGAHITG